MHVEDLHPFGRFAMGLLACLWLAGCGPTIVYDYVPPSSPEGRVCTAQCQSSAAMCRQMQQSNYQQCQSNYTLMMQNYNACRDSKGKHCVMPPSCMMSSTTHCDKGYRECFAACGGTVSARVVE